MINDKYKYSELTSAIIGAAIEVHTLLGSGFQEVIYQRGLSHELDLRNINHAREVEMDVMYKGVQIGKRRVDFLINEFISVEIKAISKLENVHFAQAINYLEAYNLEVGLLINFGEMKLKFHRLANAKFDSSKEPRVSNKN